jgi:hypothetical protein
MTVCTSRKNSLELIKLSKKRKEKKRKEKKT